MHPLRRLWRYADRRRRSIVLATLFSVANKMFDIAPEVLIGILVDTVVKRETSLLARLGVVNVEHQLLLLAGLTTLIWILESTFEYLYAVRWRNLAQYIQHDLRLDVYAHVQELPLSYFESKSSGQILSVINDDINQLERFLNGGANDLIQVGVSSVAVSVIFVVLTPQVALVALLPVPLILLGAFYFQKKLEPRYAEVRDRAGVLNGVVNNNLSGLATIKAFVAEKHEMAMVMGRSEDYQNANARAIRVASAITPVIRMGVLSGFVATLFYGGMLTLRGSLAVGAYSVLVFLTQRLLWPLTRLADMTDLYQRAMASTRRALDLLEAPIDVRDGTECWPAGELPGSIELEDVSLSYGDHPALRGVSLNVAPGTTLALVGSTGSGKSSLTKLLLRFYEPSAGRILIDGVDISTLKLSELRGAIGFVSQDVFLVDGTIAENVSYGSFDATRSQIEAAARAAEAHEFVEALPLGYDTRVGERGQKLSGGQRQRIAIARAILKNPRILVLDEATSAVDNETEAAIQRSLATITKERTTVIVAHRLSTIRHAHQICVLEGGRVVEQGTHEELVARGQRYAALWRLQTGEVD
ncbi:MAG: ABC transporter ATP-binding protein [Myxococcales bacterium]|nr:ABC transporter ATP-binding protein [Myxococcales bacterium]MCB9575735.1 ABC transporter ATP-binding protein [Polyangiaceae bacterium]